MSKEQRLVKQILAAKSGSKRALSGVISCLDPLVLSLSRRLHYSEARADLVLSLVKIVYHLPDKLFEDKNESYQRVLAYIKAALVNEEIRLAKIQQLRITRTIKLDQDLIDPSSLDWVTRSDLRLTLTPELECLTQQQREVITYRYFKDLSDQEISSTLGLSRQAVYQLRRRALAALRKRLNPTESKG